MVEARGVKIQRTVKFVTFAVEEATISSIHQAVEQGELTFRKLIERCLERIEEYDKRGPKLNSVITVNPRALEIADEMDAEFKENGLVGPLHGIPVLLKDNINTKDMATTGGSTSLEDFIPENDAHLTAKLLEAGAIILAKVNLHEFAIWGETVSSVLGQSLNPYDLSRTPGGSSGGTGAGIAANFGVIGIGTDTVNSIRSPASACSLVGIRPTLGLVSRDGIIPYSFTQDAAGPITRTVEDAVKTLEAISGYDPQDPATAWSVKNTHESYQEFLDPNGLQGARVGVLRSLFGSGPEHEDTNRVIKECLDIMAKHGAIVVEVEEEIDIDQLVEETSVHLYELERDLDSYLGQLGDRAAVHSLADILESGKHHKDIGDNLRYAQTLSTDSLEYKERLLQRQALQDKVMLMMAKQDLDVLAFPHQKQLVCKAGASQIERNGALGAITGFPSIVLPGGFSKPSETAPIGVPVGIEFFGRPWSEPTLIKIGYGFEQLTKFRRPPLSTP